MKEVKVISKFHCFEFEDIHRSMGSVTSPSVSVVLVEISVA